MQKRLFYIAKEPLSQRQNAAIAFKQNNLYKIKEFSSSYHKI